jgi:hypothetical protein
MVSDQGETVPFDSTLVASRQDLAFQAASSVARRPSDAAVADLSLGCALQGEGRERRPARLYFTGAAPMSQRLTVFAFLCCIPAAGALGLDAPPAVNIASEVMAEKGYSSTDLTSSQILEIEGVTKSERLSRSGVELYEVNREIPGLTDMMPDPNSIPGFGDGTGVAEYFEVVSMDVDGETMRYARGVPPEEIGRRRVAAGGITPEEFAEGLEAYSDALIGVGGAIREEIPLFSLFGGDLTFGGVAAERHSRVDIDDVPITQHDVLTARSATHVCARWGRGEEREQSSDPDDYVMPTDIYVSTFVGNSWLSPDPLTFLTGPACMLRFTAAVLRATDLTDEQKRAAIAQAREATNDRMQLAGREEVDGRPTHHLQMNDLGLSQTGEDGAQYEFERASVWIDQEYFVRRKMRLEGQMHAEGQSLDFFMEIVDEDYRNVPNSHLYEPYRTVMRVGGVTTPEQEREMQAALAQLEDYEQQMASMPASQRAMVERMMGDKIEQARSLASGGAVEIVMLTTSIVLDPDFGAAPSLLDDGPELVRTIQQGLTTLGYDPGPVTGQMNQQTAVAIVRFESDQGMAVTGEATPALAAAIRTANR